MMHRARSAVVLPVFLCVLSSFMSSPPAARAEEDRAASSQPSYWDLHFDLHGYVNLGYADLDLDDGDQRLGDDAILGLEEDGSFPYGNAALNLRYDLTAKHSFILQLAVSDLGDSPVDDVGGDVELDWLFYQWQLAPSTRVRIGRQPAPAGIFNELRDTGVVLPFFRPAFTFYREGAIFSETFDGVGLFHTFAASKPWSLDGAVYYGEYDVLEQGAGVSDAVTEVAVTNAIGTQFWLNTPVSGLRFGLGALQWDVDEKSSFSREEATWKSWYASVDGDFERFVARAEYRNTDVDLISVTNGQPLGVGIDIFYFQLGWRATEKLGFYVQPEYTDIEQKAAIILGGSVTARDREDVGFAVNYELNSNWRLKAEYHEVESEKSVGSEIIIGPSGVQVRRIFQTFDSSYTILSFAASF